MARTVDPQKHAARRLHIIDAALTVFARHGYHGATTAVICRQARIGSGTLFHYFPTKAAILLAIFDVGTQETRSWFEAQSGRRDARQVVLDWVRRTADEAADPRMPGFVRAVGALLSEPEVTAALVADEEAQRSGLLPWVGRAQAAGEVRVDLSAADLTSWVMLLLDGFLGRLANESSFDAPAQRDTLHDAVERLLAPAGDDRRTTA